MESIFELAEAIRASKSGLIRQTTIASSHDNDADPQISAQDLHSEKAQLLVHDLQWKLVCFAERCYWAASFKKVPNDNKVGNSAPDRLP